MSGSDFAYLRHRAGFDQQAAARFLNVSLRTIRRYEKYGAPRVAVLALAARGGEYPGWEGFMFRDGELRSTTGRSGDAHGGRESGLSGVSALVAWLGSEPQAMHSAGSCRAAAAQVVSHPRRPSQ